MSEVEQLAEEIAAPDQAATVAPETEEVVAPEEKPAEVAKTFTQEDLDAAVEAVQLYRL